MFDHFTLFMSNFIRLSYELPSYLHWILACSNDDSVEQGGLSSRSKGGEHLGCVEHDGIDSCNWWKLSAIKTDPYVNMLCGTDLGQLLASCLVMSLSDRFLVYIAYSRDDSQLYLGPDFTESIIAKYTNVNLQ